MPNLDIRILLAEGKPDRCEMPVCSCLEGRDYWDKSWQWRRSVDHIVPKCQGGGSELANLRLAHRSCNSSAGAKVGNVLLMERYRAEGKVTPWGQTREELAEMGKVQGKINAAAVFTSEHQARAGRAGGTKSRNTFEQYSAAGKIGGLAKKPGTAAAMRSRWEKMTPEERSAEATRRAHIGWETRRRNAS